MTFLDISQKIREGMPVYPGDLPVTKIIVSKIPQAEWNLSGYTFGSHSGTHIDSLLHVDPKGWDVSEIPLEKCCGEAMVIEIASISGNIVTLSDFLKFSTNLVVENRIILLKTKIGTEENSGYNDENGEAISISKDLAEFFKEKKIKAIGIDSGSIGDLETHLILLKAGILIYENLALSLIRPETYEFFGFPLKIDAEGAPVRCILKKRIIDTAKCYE